MEDYDTPALDVTPYLGTDTVGVISIPAMEMEMTLYLGASKSNMARGAVIMGGTSCSIGGENTNCVIAAHRGYSGIPYFREIERLSVGDPEAVSGFSEPKDIAIPTTEKASPAVLEEPTQQILSAEDKLKYVAPVLVVLAGVWMLLEERKMVFDTAENGDYNLDRE